MLASVNIGSAATDTLVYTAPSVKVRTAFSVRVTNRTASTVTIRIALTTGGAPAADGSNYIEYDLSLPGNQSVEETGLVLLASQALYVRCSTASAVSAVVYGIEE